MKFKNNIRNNLIIYFSTLFSFFLIIVFWDNLTIPLINNDNVVGDLTTKNYNPNNDTIRYVLSIGTPLIIFIFLNFFFKKKDLISFNQPSINTNQNEKDIKFNDIKIIFYIIITYVIFDYIINFEFSYLKLDILHDGDFLAPAKNYLLNDKSIFYNLSVHGLSNTIYPLLGWKIFNEESIGAYRIFLSLIILLLKIISVIFAFHFTKISKIKNQYKIILFVFLSYFFLSLSSYSIPMNYSPFSIRDLYLIIFLIFLIKIIFQKKKKLKYLIFLSIIPFWTLLLHVDIGLYCYLIYFIFLFYLFIKSKFKKIALCIGLTFGQFLFFYILFGANNFINFVSNIMVIINNIDLIHGLEYPRPFFDIGEKTHGSRATKALLMQLIAGLLIAKLVFSKKNKYDNSQKIILVILYVVCFISFKNALGRSDSYHIKMSTDWSAVLIFFFIAEYTLNKIQYYFKTSKDFIILIGVIFSFLPILLNINNTNINKLRFFKKDLLNYINLNDDEFLNTKSMKVILKLKTITKNENCIANLSFDLSIIYLLKKKSCTKFIAPYLASGIKNENVLIQELKNKKPKYILYDSPFSFDGIPPKKRLPVLNNFIEKYYVPFYEDDGYIILKKT